MTLEHVSTNISFPKAEESILTFWDSASIFTKSVDQHSHDRLFSFYDGPPFATGLPHYGHLLPGIIKDIVPRYWTMKGFRVERRWGWDCHGLPIENIIEDELNLKSKRDVENFGIAKFNEACRETVMRYAEEWKKTVRRIGRWIDMENAYRTMDLSFMESVWWVFGELWKKKLIFEGKKPMHICPRCVTPLSNFEVTLGYADIKDMSLIASFALTNAADKIGLTGDVRLLAWTTTPWTLPGNVLLAVNADISYTLFTLEGAETQHIVASARFDDITKGMTATAIREIPGKQLVGLTYTPLFPYFASTTNAFRVVAADFVTTEDGSGVVHIAPAFGDDDYQVGSREKIDLIQHVTMDGRFIETVSDFAGMEVKPKEDPGKCDVEIVKWLAAHGKLFSKSKITHSYPHCWRCDSPLLNYATSSWFVRVTEIKEDLLANNRQTQWIPDHVKEGRFGKWLENARDWAISRNRFWGCPLPIWKSEDGDILCVGSVAELETLSGKKITDLHKHIVDDVVIHKDGKEFRRIPEVLDCWFESGSMPYAQMHYPFENREKFEAGFPANFIAEGQDQTRGWFYTLHVLATALTRGETPSIPLSGTRPAFQNVIVNGIILAEDGKKMSKKLKNYPPPETVIDKYGADALRLYLIQSPAVRAEELRLSEKGIEEIVRKILLKWWNAYAFFTNYAMVDNWQPASEAIPELTNILDKWIVSRMQSLLKHTETEMAAYRLYAVVPKLIQFIEDLTNTYIRFNRKRFWADGASVDKDNAYHTLYTVLTTLAKTMAPFTPFMAEMTYQNLKKIGHATKESVHLEPYPLAGEGRIDVALEKSVAIMMDIVEMGRNVREKAGVKVKIPLTHLTIIHRNRDLLNQLRTLESYMAEELNIRGILYEQDEDRFVELNARPNGAVLGPRLGKRMGEIGKTIVTLDSAALRRLESGENIVIDGETISASDLLITHNPKPGHESLASNAHISIELDLTVNRDQVLEGLAREIVNRIQKLRKTADFKLDDRITIQYAAGGDLLEALRHHSRYIMDQTLATSLDEVITPEGQATETFEIENETVTVAVSTL